MAGLADSLPTTVDKYRVLRELGRGGMGTVYEVEDSSSGKRLALKRLEVETSDESAYIARQFELEFYNLSHFAHPCVVQVYDFGRDQQGLPYYTMEILDGGDLRKLSPLPYWDCCKVLIDICSVLSFLHSRRLIHRDVTPRNIRLTSNGRAKLIDFGTLAVVGPAKRLAGTPPFCAPETLTGDHIDHRADLFSLGVTAYMVLTGRLPYQARSFSELRDAWKTPLKPPSFFIKDIPETLDRLVTSMLKLDRGLRPSGAPEVMERLGVIANLKLSEDQIVRQAYLSMPTVVGREQELLRIRKLLVRALRGRGGAVLVSGAAGSGRSRLLSASVLEAKLLGLTVLRADATDILQGEFSAARVLLEQLIEAMPELAAEIRHEQLELLALLAPAIAKMEEQKSGENARSSSPPPSWRPRSELSEMRSRLQVALLELLLRATEQRVLLVAIDDIHSLDEPSASLIALLVERTLNRRLVVVATAADDALARPDESLRFIAGAAAGVALCDLGFDDTYKLLESIFGDVPNLRALVDHLFRLSAGVPGVIMQLAQHLVDRGVVSYGAGAWILPNRIREDGLPRSLTDALALKVERLSPAALTALQVLASITERALSQEDLLQLSGLESTESLMNAVDELVVADLVLVDRACYRIAHGGLGAMIRSQIDQETLRGLHLRLAHLFQENYPDNLIVVDKLVRAGEMRRALEIALPRIADIENLPVETIIASVRTLPADWRAALQSLVAYCDRGGRPRWERFEVQSLIVAVSAITASSASNDLYELLQQTYCDSGLDLYQQLDSKLTPDERLMRALELAQQRYDATPEAERVASPEVAIPRLARTLVQAVAIFDSGYDSVIRDKLPSFEPLSSLSPALKIIVRTVYTSHHMLIGAHHEAREGFLEIIDRLEQPDLGGFDPVHNRYILLNLQYGMADLEVQYGIPSALRWADIIEADPLFEVQACRIRFLYALVSGDAEKADRYRRRAELLRIQNGPPQLVERRLLVLECDCYAFVGDLGRLKQCLPEIEVMVPRSTGWEAVLYWARGLYRQLLGEYEEALNEFRAGLGKARAGENGAYLYLAAGCIETLTALGHLEQACIEGERFLLAAREADLGPLMHRPLQALAKAYAQKGEQARAVDLAEEAIARLEGFMAGGIVLGGAYETRARVALSAGDEAGYRENIEKCSALYQAERQPMLAPRYSALLQSAIPTEYPAAAEAESRSRRPPDAALRYSSTEMTTIDRRSERTFKTKQMEYALKTLVEAASAVAGHLFSIQPEGPVLNAKYGDYASPDGLRTNVETFLCAEIDSAEEVKVGPAESAALTAPFCWAAADGGLHFPTLLTHDTEEGTMINGVVVLRSPDEHPVYAPRDLCVALSRTLQESTDVKTSLAAR
ncbi:MAG: protein kinase [Deltaproteobacteria bacterium]|nr:protein kinase [Deltaproteobacteria bacterium]